jgi:hypothetical protein
MIRKVESDAGAIVIDCAGWLSVTVQTLAQRCTFSIAA